MKRYDTKYGRAMTFTISVKSFGDAAFVKGLLDHMGCVYLFEHDIWHHFAVYFDDTEVNFIEIDKLLKWLDDLGIEYNTDFWSADISDL